MKFIKIKSADMPTKPKPTEQLPNNLMYVWDPNANDWIILQKDTNKATPPLYDPNNQNVVNQTTSYMSNIKSASVIDGEEDEDPLSVKLSDLFLSDSSLVDSYIKKEISCNDILDILGIEIKNKNEYKEVYNCIKEFIEDNYMGTIKSASLEITDKNGKIAEEGMWLYKPMNHSTFRGDIPLKLFQVKIRHQKDGIDKPYLLSENKLITKGINHIKDGILFDTYEEAKQYSESHKTKEEKEFDKLDDWQKIDYYLSKQSSCLAKFLDGPQFSKEIKIEAGLIKNGLVKYAGFDFNRGTKYAITTKGLEVLRRASEAEHNEALNEREKLAYMFGFNTDEVSTLDTTGKVIKSEEDSEYLDEPFYTSTKPSKKIDTLKELQDFIVGAETVYFVNKPKGISIKNTPEKMQKLKMLKKDIERAKEILSKYNYGQVKSYKKFGSKKWTICEADGTELGEVEADSELDAKVKFGIEHPEYADSQSISAKAVKASKEFFVEYQYPARTGDAWYITTDKIEANTEEEALQIAKEKLVGADNFHIVNKCFSNSDLITKDSEPKYFHQDWYYDGEKLRNEYTDDKEIDAKYEETTESHEPYPNPSETPHDDIVLENHDGWVNTADNHFEYTEEQKRLLPLFKLVNQYVLRKEAIISEDVQNDDGFVVSGTAEIINDLEHKIKDLGFYCEPVAEIVDNSYIGKDIYSLRVFEK